jgi:Ca-activated chloride channel homolog
VSARGDPILAHRYYGLGRVVAWTSDAAGRWAADWLAWPGAPDFFARMLRWTMAEPIDPRLRVSAAVVGRQVTLRADSVDETGTFADGLDTRATVVTPDGRAIEVRLPQAGPGRYEQPLQLDQPGVYRVLVRQAQREELSGFLIDGAAETRALGTNTSLLDLLASQTGGQRLDAPEQVFARRSAPSAPSRELPLWPWLLGAALSLWPLDVALRRLRLPLRLRGWGWRRRGDGLAS